MVLMCLFLDPEDFNFDYMEKGSSFCISFCLLREKKNVVERER